MAYNVKPTEDASILTSNPNINVVKEEDKKDYQVNTTDDIDNKCDLAEEIREMKIMIEKMSRLLQQFKVD
jgi:hypothetical protein